MKSSAGSEELQAHFRLIGQALARAECSFFWFGDLGLSLYDCTDETSVSDFLRQELLGIRTGDIELYLEDLQELLRETNNPNAAHLCLENAEHRTQGSARWFAAFASEKRRLRMFIEAIDREIRRRQGEIDGGGTPLAAAYTLNVSFRG